MVAAEEKLVAIKQDRMSARMTGNRNREQIVVEPERFFSAHQAFDPKSRRAIICVHESFTGELFRKPRMVLMSCSRSALGIASSCGRPNLSRR